MFLQSVTTRVAVMITVLMIGLTGIAYAVGHLSDRPLLMAYVDQSQSNGGENLYAYLVDPVRRLNIPINLPVPVTDGIFHGISPEEPHSFYLNYHATEAESQTSVYRLYRYNFRTNDLTTVYETVHDKLLRSFSSSPFDFASRGEQHYLVADRLRHAVITIDRKTLAQRILWQGEGIPDEAPNYILQASPSRSRDKIAILDSSQEPATVTIVTLDSEVIKEFPTFDPSQKWIMWLPDDRHTLAVARTNPTGTEMDFGVYDTVTGQPNPYTESLRAFNVQPVYECQDKGQWISYIKRAGDNRYQLFTMDLATGATYEHATFEAETGAFGVPIRTNSDCSLLLQTTPGKEAGTNDVYLTTLKGENLQPLLSNVLVGWFIDEDTFSYTQANETGGYDLYAISVDEEPTSELLLADLPTPNIPRIADILQRGWLVYYENPWGGPQSPGALRSGNPLLYYDIQSREAHVLTPPNVRIMWFTEVP